MREEEKIYINRACPIGCLGNIEKESNSLSNGGLSEINGQPLKVYSELALERIKQDDKWGEQNHHPMEWLAILGEEVGEVNKAALEAHFAGYKRTGNLDDYREELVQVAAVAVAMVESLDRDKWKKDR